MTDNSLCYNSHYVFEQLYTGCLWNTSIDCGINFNIVLFLVFDIVQHPRDVLSFQK